ncbi:MAG: 7-carboxy-7-deazaguanine synthase QueE [Anaerolineales bacterium]|nr:7-carboxy-7-deazaguanine synthase QueE [Anaerolineales bacterium]
MSQITYPVNDVYACVQGEGCQTGVAMVLLRLHGCAVGCPWCDTKETWDFLPELAQTDLASALGSNGRYVNLSPSAIVAYMREHMPGPRWVLLTGGEPAQYDLRPLVKSLHEGGYLVALETSGTELGHVGADIDWVCVSPKIDMPGGKQVLPEALATADEIKHVVGKQKDIDLLDELLAGAILKPSVQICLQPISISPKATDLCTETVIARGWRLSVQTHKYIGVR